MITEIIVEEKEEVVQKIIDDLDPTEVIRNDLGDGSHFWVNGSRDDINNMFHNISENGIYFKVITFINSRD